MKISSRRQIAAALTVVVVLVSVLSVGTVLASHNQSEPNDTFADAVEITGGEFADTELGTASKITGNVNDNKDYDFDWFKFPVNASRNDFTLNIVNDISEDGDVAVELYDPSGNLVKKVQTDSDGETLSYNVTDSSKHGDWRIKIYAADDPKNNNGNAAEDCGSNAGCDGTYSGTFSYPPEAAASLDDADNVVLEGQTVTLNGSGTTDPDDAGSLSYSWSFGDGNSGSGETVGHQFETGANGSSETVTSKLTVTDGGGGSDTADTAPITVYSDYDGDGKADNDTVSSFPNDDDDDNDGVDDANDTADFDVDADNDGLDDGAEDEDGDGVLDPGETDPSKADTDGDTIGDDVEGAASDIDTDGDGTPDARDTDSDDDGVDDGAEGTNDNDGDGVVAYRDSSPRFTEGDSLSAIDEDPDSNPGTNVSTLLTDEFSDVDGGSDGFAGVAIAGDAATGSEGSWQYSTDGGGSWSNVGSVSSTSALLVPANARLRFAPASDYNGNPGGLTVYAVDDGESTTFSQGSTRWTFDVTSDSAVSAVSPSGVTVDVTVNAVSDPPNTSADGYSVKEDGTLRVESNGVLSNDTDPDGDALTLSTTPVEAPSNGNLTLYPNGSFEYVPDENFAGSDSFTYQVADGNGGTTTGNVSLTVNARNDPPTPAQDTYEVNKNRGFVVSSPGIVSNDDDLEGDNLSVVTGATGQPAHGTVTTYANGSFEYVPDQDFVGSDSFTYRLSDGNGGRATGVVQLTVSNDPPVVRISGSRTVRSGEKVTLDGSFSSDPNGDSLTYQWGQTRGPAVNISDSNSTVATFTAPDVDQPTVIGIGLSVYDGDLGASAVTVITVRPDNTPPVADAGSNRSVTSGGTTTLVGSNSRDPDGDSLRYEWTQLAGPTVSLTGTGPNATVRVPEVDTERTVRFRLTVDDGEATATDTTSVEISPGGTGNRPPTAAVGPNRTVVANESVTLSATNSTDPDGDSLGFEWSQTAGPNVSLSGDETATPTFTVPPVDGSKTLRFEVTVSDGNATATADVAVTVVETVLDRFDENDDGVVSTPELQAAIRTWATGGITTDQLQTVIRAWATGG